MKQFGERCPAGPVFSDIKGHTGFAHTVDFNKDGLCLSRATEQQNKHLLSSLQSNTFEAYTRTLAHGCFCNYRHLYVPAVKFRVYFQICLYGASQIYILYYNKS